MSTQNTTTKSAGDTLVSAIGSAAGAVADPKGGMKRLKSAVLSPKPLAVAAGLIAAYVFGWRCGHRAATR